MRRDENKNTYLKNKKDEKVVRILRRKWLNNWAIKKESPNYYKIEMYSIK